MTNIEATYGTFKVTLEEIEHHIYSVRIEILGNTLNLGNVIGATIHDNDYIDQFIIFKLCFFLPIILFELMDKIFDFF